MFRVCATLLFLSIFLSVPSSDAGQTVRVVVTSDYPPFNFIDERRRLAGFDIDIAKALCAAMKVECEFVQVRSFEDLIPTLVSGKADAAVASMSITEERKRKVAFTNHYYRTPMQFVGPKGFARPVTRDGLRGSRIAAERGTTAENYIRKEFGDSVELVLSATQDESMEALISGRVDLLLSDSLGMWHFVNSGKGRGFAFAGNPIFVDEGIGIALRHQDAELLKAFNKALTRIRIDGTYDRINAKYFPFSIY